jgi:hypothetical protein
VIGVFAMTSAPSTNSGLSSLRSTLYSLTSVLSGEVIVTLIIRSESPSSRLTVPSISASVASALGCLASKSSTTLGRPAVMSSPAMPPVWKVRIVSCVPGSPMDWAAMMPTASPTSTAR